VWQRALIAWSDYPGSNRLLWTQEHCCNSFAEPLRNRHLYESPWMDPICRRHRKLIEMRGVHRHRGGPERHCFVMSQTPIATKALALQKHTFPGQEEWKSAPWADDPASKSSGHFIHICRDLWTSRRWQLPHGVKSVQAHGYDDCAANMARD
jgi:hypothetical protein